MFDYLPIPAPLLPFLPGWNNPSAISSATPQTMAPSATLKAGQCQPAR
jgi:hypothetical protein